MCALPMTNGRFFPLFEMILRIRPIGPNGQTTRMSATSKLERSPESPLGPGLLHRFALSRTVALYILQGPQGDRAFPA